MHIVLLSGGSGKRLWPLSNDIRSKQFLKLFPAADGSYQSMVQRVYQQILSVEPTADITVATSKSQVSSLRNQLGDDLDLSVEPCRRDTFPAIALACAYLKDVKHIGVQETVAICPVDPYVDAEYFAQVRRLTELSQAGSANLMLMGIEPTYPSAKYGYIMPDDKMDISKVSAFREKPDEATAADYIAGGALWNSGVFAFRLGYVLQRAQQLLGYQDHETLYRNYADLQKISFDYAVVEQEKDIGVLRYAGEWKDLGTWNTLTEVMREPGIGEVAMNKSCQNVHAINELDIPLLCMGAKDMVVVASPEGILVSDKKESSYIKPYVEAFDHQTMVAEKSWGKFQIIDVEDESITVKVTLNAGHAMNYHSHAHRQEVWNVVSGEGISTVEGVCTPVQAGSTIKLPQGSKHMLKAVTDMRVIEVQMGKDISKEDKKKW
ncbi:MAG: cupin domain-containing protein [Selenomonas sp.]|jgi:mannose-1-phosphate guanylyltransferase|nr:cupin domain-containing protein [Selenomonas sp.]